MDIQPYTITIPDAELADLHARLDQTRWPASLGEDWSRGTPVGYAQQLAASWRNSYDWRAAEARLNELGQFRTEIDGQPIHGLHVRSSRADAVPLLLCHGYPSSFVEFAGIAASLAEPDDDGVPAFHVIAPSIPGFGFSGPLTARGWDVARTAAAFDGLMQALGYQRYGVFGEDVGAGIVEDLCTDAAERVSGALVATDPGAIATQFAPPAEHLTAEEKSHLEALRAARSEDFGYLAIQSTRPLSVAYGLTDSPVMQLTWIAEKVREWTDPSRELPQDAVDLDQLLTLVTVSWFGKAGDGAAALIYEAAHAQVAWGRGHDRPMGMTCFGEEPLVRRLLDHDGRLAFWADHAEGGHFPAMEAPEALVGDLRAFFALDAVR